MGQSHSSWGPGWPKGATVPISTYTFNGVDGNTNFGQMATELHPMLDILLTETERRGYIVRQRLGCWGYNNRPIANTQIPSNHSRATAADVNAVENGYGDQTPQFPAKIAHEVWEECGWEWGGDWSSGGVDGMHLEYLGARSTVKARTEKAQRLFGGLEDDMSDFVDGIKLARQGKAPQSDASQDKKLGHWLAEQAMKDGGAAEGTEGPHMHDVPGTKTGPPKAA